MMRRIQDKDVLSEKMVGDGTRDQRGCCCGGLWLIAGC